MQTRAHPRRTDINCAAMEYVCGDATGLLIPAHIDALRSGGETFLTESFRVFGSLSSDNRITRITRFETCPGGSTGQKLLLSVEYEQSDARLHTDLFVKFSRDFADPIRDDRGKHEMESEVRFAAISRLPGFPINVPTAYFADYHHESCTGILITQRIGFGTGGIEPHHAKCSDHDLLEPVAYYRVIVQALARLAASHKSGRLSPVIIARFPFDPGIAAGSNPIPFDARELRIRVARYSDFAVRYSQLLPANITAPAFIAKLDQQVGRFLEHDATIKRFLLSNPDFIALCHWNANIDNAWFWRDASGALQCGLMDWGHVNQMSVAYALWGCLSGAGLEVWNCHLDELLTLFTAELCEHGGPRLAVAELKLHLQLYAARMALAYFLECPARILFRMPDVAAASGPLDPMFRHNDTARNQLSMLTVVMNLWESHDFGAVLDRLLERMPAAAGQTSV